MYVILKGRVAVEKKSEECLGHPIIVALLKDGDHFGELGLIDQTNIEDNIKDTAFLHDKYIEFKHTYARRKASCITAEETDMLMLNKELCFLLY